MNRNLQIHRYELFSRSGLNAKSNRRGHCGALIRFENGPGVGCIHPWPELGDDPIDVQLKKLASGKSTPLIEQALLAASFDWLTELAHVSIPKSHYTCVDSKSANPTAVFENGFGTVKLKGDGNKLAVLKSEMTRWADAGFRIRVDFNESGESVAAMLEWWKILEIKNCIDFLEDPLPWNSKEWRLLKDANIPLAADRGLEIPEKAALADWWVVKPALTDAASMADSARKAGKRVIVTSYMDHAVGQLWAAYWAGKCVVTADCGLMTHELFADDPFFKVIQTQDASFLRVPDLGQEIKSLLNCEIWEDLELQD